MNLSISNIAWAKEDDEKMYAFLQAEGYKGLEIAPTRLFPVKPYDCLREVKNFSKNLHAKYGLTICSMQSIWFGFDHNIFSNEADRDFLVAYTKKAIGFASVIGCKNIVFGCPKNRIIPSDDYLPVAYAFFKKIGDIAEKNNTVIAVEANPPIYNTNFINTTQQAFDLCREVNCKGLRVNIDLGTCIYNGESFDLIKSNIDLVNHIHISEPYLRPIEKRKIHTDLSKLDYHNYLSIEMAYVKNIETVKDAIKYIRDVIG